MMATEQASSGPAEHLSQMRRHLTRPVDPASLVVFRILFGVLMAASAVRFVAKGWVHQLYVAPNFHFSFWGFDWVRPWPEWGMYLHFAAIAVLGLLVAAGLWYRISITLFFLLFTYVELIDPTYYLNHYYFISCLSLLMIFLPLGRVGSVDVWRRPERRLHSVPAWVRGVLLFQIGIVYFFAGLAKLHPDWLLDAEPLATWLRARAHFPLLGPLFDWPPTAHLMSWAGAIFDLAAPFALLWRRTRPFAYVAVVCFHALTAWLFYIGMFPWIMIALTTLFFDPSWPRRFLKMNWLPQSADGRRGSLPSKIAMAAFGIWASVQILMPLRHHLYPGEVRWTREGFRYSWMVMLVEAAGTTRLRVVDAETGEAQTVRPEELLTPLQYKMMTVRPEMILELAHHVAREAEARTGRPVAVYADTYVAWNGHPSARLIDPAVDLTRERRGPQHHDWILPYPNDR